MKPNISFDTGPIISLAMNGLLWILDPLKRQFGGEFYITPAVKTELIDTPMRGKKFEFEALRVGYEIKNDVLTLIESDEIKKLSRKISDLANTTYSSQGNWIKIVHDGEMDALAAAVLMKSHAFVVDERTTRLLIEEPTLIVERLKRKLHANISVNENNLKELKKIISNVRVIRSVELVSIAFETGIVDKYAPELPEGKKVLIDSLLWSMKLSGCSVSDEEIKKLKKMTLENKLT